MSGCEGLCKRLTDILDTEIGDDAVALRAALWDALNTPGTYPVIVSGPDVRDPIYVQWPGDPKAVQYRPVPVIGMRQRPGWGEATTSGWIPGPTIPGTPTGVERRQA